MGKMTGNEFLVKALQEEGVEKIFGYPGACVIDIFDEIYKQDQVELMSWSCRRPLSPDSSQCLEYYYLLSATVPVPRLNIYQ